MKNTLAKILLVAAFLSVIGFEMPAAASDTGVLLANKNMKIVAEQQGARIILKLQTPTGVDVLIAGPPQERDSGWKSVLRSELFSRLSGKEESLFFTTVEQPARKRTLLLSGSSKNVSVVREVSLLAEYPAAYVVDKWHLGPSARVEALLSSYNFAPRGKSHSEMQPLDFVWTPNLRPQPNDIIADHVFRSPAIMLQKDSLFVALIPDLQYLMKHRVMPMAMDFQLPQFDQPDSGAATSATVDSSRRSIPPAHAAPILSFGFWPWQVRDHVYYLPDSTHALQLQDTEVSYAYYLWLDHRATPFTRAISAKTKSAAFRRVVDFLWEKFTPLHREGNVGALPGTLDLMAQRAWKQYAEQTWFETTLNGRPVGGLRSERLAWSNGLPEEVNNDVWFNSWFQTLRTAYGMYLYGKRNREALLMERAEKVLNLALSAPNEDGIFPSIYYLTYGVGGDRDAAGKSVPISAAMAGATKAKITKPPVHHWVGDEGWAGFGNDYNHTFDASWTGYWLLRWADLLPQRRQEILAFCRKYAGFLLKWQQPSGVIPSWFHRGDNQPREEFFHENAETAGSALFLAELFSRTKEQPYLEAAVKAMDYLTREILPRNKWFDYETFVSCSRKPFDFFDAMTGQFPQNTLSMNQAAKAYLTLYQITGNREYLNLGTHVLDYLLLHQQVWSPPFLSRNLLGGFGVQNTDGEWSDARQAYFAETLMDYYEATQKRAYFERAAEALRSTFALFHRDTPICYENWAHSGVDRPGAITGIHWGTGSAATSFELLRDRMGDAYIFMGEKPGATWSSGVNALWIENLKIAADTIRFNLLSDVSWGRRAWIKFGNVPPGRYRVKINDEPVVPFTDNLLSKGIYMPVRRVPAVAHTPPQHFYSRSPKPLQLNLNVSGARADFAAKLYLRADSPGRSGFQVIPFRASLDKSGWVANLPENYKHEGTSFQYYITWVRNGKLQRLPKVTSSAEFYRGEVQPFMFADCGDDDEAYLGQEKDSWVSVFEGGGKDRFADGEQWFSYVFPIQSSTQRVKVTFSANGECRVAAGDSVLLDEGDAGPDEITEHAFTLDTPQLWAGGNLVLRFSDADPKDGWGPNVGWIKVEEIAAESQ
ncbi:MAG: hypothetical protein ONB44_09235 [candidate division KSB1 bacterium]|nr:hypothetical protein [candidate division KSB1 bacterium]MDZ7302313.1 hypothetical protein [candidate division KSB1 bacterium]MDZ7311166.1 hypothetical protein [candidate division KSB1 bacterium]